MEAFIIIPELIAGPSILELILTLLIGVPLLIFFSLPFIMPILLVISFFVFPEIYLVIGTLYILWCILKGIFKLLKAIVSAIAGLF